MLRFFSTHLQFKLIGVICLILFVTLGLVSVVIYYKTNAMLSKDMEDIQQSAASDYAKEVEFEFASLLNNTYAIATSEQIANTTDKNEIRRILIREHKRYPMFSALWYFNMDGISIDTTGLETKSDERDYFQIVKRTQKPYISNPYISKVTKKYVVAVVYPVFRNGKMDGMVNAVYPADKILDKLQTAKFGKTGYAILVGGDGVVVAEGKNADFLGKLNLTKQDIAEELKTYHKKLDEKLIQSTKDVLGGNKGHTSYISYDNTARYGVFNPIQLGEQQRWGLIVTTENSELKERANDLLMWVLLISVIMLLISGSAAYLFGIKFVRPILITNQEMRLVAEGNLEKRCIAVQSTDEIGQMVESFLVMRDALATIVAKVNQESQQVAAASEELNAEAEQSAKVSNQIAVSTTEVAGHTDKQKLLVDETAEVVRQMCQNIQKVSDNINMLSTQSVRASEAAKDGGKTVEDAIKHMGKIECTVSSSAKVVAQLGVRSKEIGQFVDAISSIAGQTNLLALNAAIEAARAGEQGRGFAVVAEEVRKLAEQSQQATERIAKLISEIQSETNQAVIAMDEGTRDVKDGAGIVSKAGNAFYEIIQLISNLALQANENFKSIDKLNTGSQTIVAVVQQLDELTATINGEVQTMSAATEEQSASTEEISSSSRTLAKMAEDLQVVVGKFHI